MLASISLLALLLASPVIAGKAGSFADGGNTQVSAMMMFVGNKDKVYIIDKAEGNAAQIKEHPAWGAVWDFNTHQTEVMDIKTNVFCASGMHLPNGSYVTFGGNGAIAPGGNIGSVPNGQGAASYDATYQDYDGSKSIRILNPCTDTDDFTSTNCQWFDNPDVLSMQKKRWYSAAEPLGDGSVALIGGFVNGGYINRNTPNTDPELEGGAAEPTYEFYPANGRNATVMQFMIKTSGLNAYAHTYLMPSGKMLVQANISTMLWDPDSNTETDLPAMPGNVARVYPASGAVAMLPLTPANNYTPTVIFCGGSDMPDNLWGNYSFPNTDTWLYPASKDCQRITPEPADGSAPVYVQDDDMIEGRTMGQFIILPDGKMLVVNGGLNGTAGYATNTGTTLSYSQMPFGMSLASGPVGTPALYDPNAPVGSRWSNSGFSTSNIARLYHSSAILLPDASVLIAGSNPNVDVNLTTYFPTTYQAEIFYPAYFSATTRPIPSGIPTTLSYGGDSFDITVPASSYSGSGNDAADNTTVVVVRPGWTTHGMNMGQRFLQLNNTYTVNSDGSLTLHTAQMPPNSNIFQPGPAMVFVVVNGIPSNGTFVIVGSGNVETQATAGASVLPASVLLSGASGSADGSSTSSGDNPTNASGSTVSHTAVIVGTVVAGIIILGVIGALIGVCASRRRRAAAQKNPNVSSYPMSNTPLGSKTLGAAGYGGGLRSSDSSAFSLQRDFNDSQQWSGSSANLTGDGRLSPYHDAPPYLDDSRGPHGMSIELNPYAAQSRMSTSSPHGQGY
ncbi:glyoxal oxidase N-terminus-domain-containing protein [Lentinula lateritia]|uniref:Glyoxal oxidase N-terminus-domain-containing protein n=1 Tax=Lentinula lateritia TaxID=40482 RepID=A0ABQ8V2J7_9AGAR|nr:glyoxal oxidase N-terminus-domain-containing protein [Lentinula lateritia]